MHFGELTPPEQRVLGCLIEKRWTTPEQYPLSLNALRLACNQSTNRDPVTTYDEATVGAAAQRLSRYGLTRLASGHSSRAVKYRHLAEEGLGLGREPLAVLCVLLLRGPQTAGEIKARAERMAPLATLADVERVLAELGERGYARARPRRPGQKEVRFEHLLGGDGADSEVGDAAGDEVHAWTGDRAEARAGDRAEAGDGAQAAPGETMTPSEPVVADRLESRVAALEAEVERLRAELAELRDRA
ncbi:MAG TPA: YceH family protein [Solirubrobacteraceae bacterium]